MWPPRARSYWAKLAAVSLKSRISVPFGISAPFTSSWKRQMWGAASRPAAATAARSAAGGGHAPSVAITVHAQPCAA